MVALVKDEFRSLAAIDDHLLEFSVNGVRVANKAGAWEAEMAFQRGRPDRPNITVKVLDEGKRVVVESQDERTGELAREDAWSRPICESRPTRSYLCATADGRISVHVIYTCVLDPLLP